MEVEVIALDTTCIEAEWVKNLMSELLLIPKLVLAISIHYDNKAVIELINQKSTNKKIKQHIRIHQKIVRQLKKSDTIFLEFIKSKKT